MTKGANGWTPERRKRQAELIRSWQPWATSTGPKTPEGKATSAQNAYKADLRSATAKRCGVCKTSQPISAFRVMPSRSTGRTSQCRTCEVRGLLTANGILTTGDLPDELVQAKELHLLIRHLLRSKREKHPHPAR